MRPRNQCLAFRPPVAMQRLLGRMTPSGYLLVIDGTRRNTLEVARRLHKEAVERYGDLPFVTLVNKSDLESEWEVTADDIDELERDGFTPVRSSAKEGANIERAMALLGRLVR